MLRYACRKQNHFNYYLPIIIKNMQLDKPQQSDSNHSDYQILAVSDDQLLSSRIDEFNHALQKFKRFLDQLKCQKIERFEDEIIEYSGKKIIKTLSNDDVINLCVKRIQKMVRNKKTKKNWNSNDVHILVWILNKYAAFYAQKSIYLFDEQDWKFVSSLIPATSGRKCMFKWLSLKKFSLMEFKWSKEESILLESLAEKSEKKDWKRISQEVYLYKSSMKQVFRTAKQCREHWNCYANPQIKKGTWSVKQDIRLLECVLQLNCVKKWSQVSKSIKGRTQNAVKNRFSLLLEKEKVPDVQQDQKELINRILLRLLQENSIQQLGLEEEQLEEIDVRGELFEGYRSSFAEKRVNELVEGNINNNHSARGLNGNGQLINTANLIVPAVVLNPPVYPLQTYYPVAPSFNPYFFNFLYGGYYQIN